MKPLVIRQLVIGCAVCTSHYEKDGYTKVKHRGKLRLLTHLIYEHFNKTSVPAGLVIRHSCDRPECVNPKHLQLGTHADNVADRVERGRSALGTANGRSKLTEEKVREIKSLKQSGDSANSVAKIYGVDGKVIRDIWAGLKWKHVK